MNSFLSFFVTGISLGSIYALIALGYTMVYGIAKMLNFAHGDIIMIGGYVVLTTMTGLSSALAGTGMDTATVTLISVITAMAAGILACIILGVVIEKVAYKPLRNTSPLTVLITAIGVSYFLQNLALLIFGSAAKSFKSVVPSFSVGGALNISGETIVTVVVTVIIMAALTWFVNKTKTGKSMQAVSEDKGAAQLMGINVNKTISITFAIGSGLAAVASILLCSTYPQISPYTGAMPGIKAFTAAVFGGIGSIPGAMIGGVVLGIIESLSKAYISSQMSDAIVFGVLIVVLLVKPTGLLGRKINEKV